MGRRHPAKNPIILDILVAADALVGVGRWSGSLVLTMAKSRVLKRPAALCQSARKRQRRGGGHQTSEGQVGDVGHSASRANASQPHTVTGTVRPALPINDKLKFDLSTFISDMMSIARVKRNQQEPQPLRIVTGCSGAGTPTLVLASMLGGRHAVQELFASEIDKAAAYFLLRNTDPGHVFEAGHTRTQIFDMV